jgi:hypothetical protein
MQYNTARELMKIKEYGRGVQDMVKHLKTIEDKEKRQRNAEAIIETMSMLTPLQKNIEDYKHTLWDHLFLIAGYELDVESPYGIPTQAEKQKKPEPIKYPKTKIKWNHFGAKFEKNILANFPSVAQLLLLTLTPYCFDLAKSVFCFLLCSDFFISDSFINCSSCVLYILIFLSKALSFTLQVEAGITTPSLLSIFLS